MMIRLAEVKDIERMVELGEEAYRLTGYADIGLPYNKEETHDFVFSRIIQKESLVLVVWADGKIVGFFAISISAWPYSNGNVAIEDFWYIEPKYRTLKKTLAIIEWAESWALLNGVKAIWMSAIQVKNSGLTALYERKGYKLLHSHFGKEV